MILSGKIDSVPVLDLESFQQALRAKLSGEHRLLSLFGSPTSDPNVFHLNAALLARAGSDTKEPLRLLRGAIRLSETLRAMTDEFHLLHCFERELAEQYPLRITGHPWLKPIREVSEREYPYFQLEGKEVHEVGVGPIHAGVIEPGHFRFMCFGETVHHLEIQLGYQHRGIEPLLLKGNPARLAPLVETIAGDTSIAHAWAYSQAWEALCASQVSIEAELSRGIALELERIAMHLAGLSGLATDIAFLPGSSTYGRLRTTAINASMRLCGNRFGRGWIRPGEARWNFDAETAKEVMDALRALRKDIAGINDHFQSARSVRHRLKETGKLSKQDALRLGFVGLVARSCGVGMDLRHDLPDRVHRLIPLPLIVEEDGDCWARARTRIREIDHSLKWIFSAFETLLEKTQGNEKATWKTSLRSAEPRSFALSVIEGWRGEVVHFLETDGAGNLLRYKAQDPSLRNWFALALCVRGNEISDFPICNKSFDLSYCGHDL